MSDVFNEDDAALVLRLYERFHCYGNCYAQIVNLDNQHCIKKLERMGVVYVFDLFTVGAEFSSTMNKWYFILNQNHPDVKAIIDAMELL